MEAAYSFVSNISNLFNFSSETLGDAASAATSSSNKCDAIFFDKISPSFPKFIQKVRKWQHENLMDQEHAISTANESSSRIIYKQDKKIFVQGGYEDSLETLKKLEQFGGSLDEIKLCCPSNQLIFLAVEKFPELTAFSIEAQPRGVRWPNFDARGIASIEKFPHLKSLVLDWTFGPIGGVDPIGYLLNSTHLKSQLEVFKYRTYYCLTPEEAEALADYQQLKMLSIVLDDTEENDQSWRVYIKLINSQPLQASLKSLRLERAVLRDPALAALFVESLSRLINLENFIFTSQLAYLSEQQHTNSSSIPSQEIQRLLIALPQLKTLFWNGVQWDDAICQSVKEMPYLEELHLPDCSKVSEQGFHWMLENKPNLKNLYLGNSQVNWDLSILGALQSLKELSLANFTQNEGLTSLCQQQNFQNNLESLSIIDSLFYTEEFAALSNLKGLKHLKIQNCLKYNDDSFGPFRDSKSKNCIESLQLVGVSISSQSEEILLEMPNLKQLMLGNCFAWTKEGYTKMLYSPIFQKNIQILLLNDPLVLDINLMVNFVALNSLGYFPLNKPASSEQIKTLCRERNWQFYNLSPDYQTIFFIFMQRNSLYYGPNTSQYFNNI